MIDLEITNINKINKWKLKAKKMGATGLVIFSTIPCLIGCRKDTNYTEQQHVYYAGISGNSVTLSPEASNIDLEDLKENGKDIKSLYLSFCNYIDDLSIIVEYCPNLEILEIKLVYSQTQIHSKIQVIILVIQKSIIVIIQIF